MEPQKKLDARGLFCPEPVFRTKIEIEKTSLAELLRSFNELDSSSLVEILLAYDNLSDFFINVDSFNTIQKAIQQSFIDIRSTKEGVEEEKEDLQNEKSEELELRDLQVYEKNRIEKDEAEKQRLLDITKGEEAEYQKIISDKKAKHKTFAIAFGKRFSAFVAFAIFIFTAIVGKFQTPVINYYLWMSILLSFIFLLFPSEKLARIFFKILLTLVTPL